MDAIDAGLEKAWYLDVFDKYGQTAISAASEMVRAAVVLASAAFATVAAFAGGGGICCIHLRVAAPRFFRLPCGCGPDACCCRDSDAAMTRMLMLLWSAGFGAICREIAVSRSQNRNCRQQKQNSLLLGLRERPLGGAVLSPLVSVLCLLCSVFCALVSGLFALRSAICHCLTLCLTLCHSLSHSLSISLWVICRWRNY